VIGLWISSSASRGRWNEIAISVGPFMHHIWRGADVMDSSFAIKFITFLAVDWLRDCGAAADSAKQTDAQAVLKKTTANGAVASACDGGAAGEGRSGSQTGQTWSSLPLSDRLDLSPSSH
jgi:hypothetical protein